MITKQATARFVEHLASVGQETLPPTVEQRVRHSILDHLGCALVGARLPHVTPHFNAMASLGGKPESMCADGRRRPAFLAAYLNGTCANALDYDDLLHGHPGSSIIAAALAIGARNGASLDDVIRAVTVGYEAHWLLLTAAAPSPGRAAKVRGPGTFDAIAAGMAAAAVSEPSSERLARVLSIAATQSCVPFVGKWYERPVPTVKNNSGWIAASAVLAVDLADSGAGGVSNALDGSSGFWVMAGSDQWAWDQAIAQVEEPAVLRVAYKRFPACWHTQQYLTALDSQLRGLPDGRRVRTVRIEGPADLQKFAETEVYGPADVAFSIRTLSAMLVLGVPAGPSWVSPQAIAAASANLANFEVRHAQSRAVVLTLDNADVVRASVQKDDYARPHPFGLSEPEVQSKFIRLAKAVIGSDAAARVCEDVLYGDGSVDVREILELAAAQPASVY